MNQVLGVYADEKGKTLWVCSNNLQNKGEATAAMAFDLKTGAVKGTYVLPGDGTLCNDIAVAPTAQLYVTDTRQGSVVMVKPGGKNLEIAAKDPLLAGADGLAFGDKTILYVNSVTAGKLLRAGSGAGREVEERCGAQAFAAARPSRRHARDRQEPAAAGRELGQDEHRDVPGAQPENAVITTIKEGLE